MNLLLLNARDMIDDNHAHIDDHRAQHLLQVNQSMVGDSVKVGMLNGDLGTATILDISNQSLSLEVELQRRPPKPLPLTLIMALPRPKMLKRTLQTIATMGVKELIFLNSYRVEKSYWQSPLLSADEIHKHLLLGLEQGGDTVLPKVEIRKRFKPFVEDELPGLCQNRRALVAHPYTATPCPPPSDEDTVLVIGPEGGFIPYEVEKLSEAGCQPVHLGERILRVETAVPVLLAKLFNC